MDTKDEPDEFENIRRSLKEFSKAKLKIHEDIRTTQIEIKVVQQRSLRLRKEVDDSQRCYENFTAKYDRLRSKLLELSRCKHEISSLRSRFAELTELLEARFQENRRQLSCLKEDLARQRNESAVEYAKRMEDKRQELERELSALRSDLAAQDEEQAIREQEREHNEELEILRAHIASELEQEKDDAHNNCQLKVHGLRTRIQELEGRVAALRKSFSSF